MAVVLLTPLLTWAQISISGNVRSQEDNEGLPGVNVVVKGTTTGTVTDIEGNYALDVPGQSAILVFSSVGYASREVTVGTQTVIDLKLVADITSLEELVVIGYGSIKRANVTNAISKVNSESIEDRPITNLSEAFQGQIAGVYAKQASGLPGEPFQIEIRGVNSITSGSEPLYVVDGLPIQDMKDINMMDVESIEVLKDASAAAIYGARGAGGIVLITTKKGKAGETRIDFDFYTGLQTLSNPIPMQSGPERIEAQEWFQKERYRRDGKGNPFEDPSITFDVMGSRYQQLRFWYDDRSYMISDTDWQKEGLKPAPKSQYSLTFTKGIENGSFMINATYLDQTGVMAGTGYDRFNFRANSNYKLFDRLEVGMNLAASYSLEDGNSTEGKENPYMRLITMEPTVPADANYRGHPEGLIAADPNPILQGERIKDDTRTMRTMGNAYAGFEIIEGLKLNGQVGLDMRSVEWTYFKPMDLNKKERREGKQRNTNGYKTLYQGTLDYNRSFGDHTIGALAGISQEFYHQKRVFLDSWDFATDDIHTFNTAATFRNWDDSETEWALVSYFGRLQYNFNDRYLFSASIRRDGSSRFGEDNKWGVFPAFSGAWRISEENFMSSVDWLSNLKIRASWGQTGNDNIGNYSSYGRLNPSNYAYGGNLIFGFAPSSPDNPSLSWETTTTTNLGLDFGILANRVSLSVDIYQNDTEDLLFDVPAPAISGFKGSLTLNSGAIQNKGIEVELTSTNIRKGPFTWKTMFNFSRNVNEVKSLGYGIQSIIGQLRSQPTHITTAGLPIMSYYLYDYDGLYTQEDIDNPNVAKYNNAEAGNEKIIDQNGDGIIDDDDRTVVGDNLPDAIMGMTNTFKFGNFDLSILLTASLGYDSYFMFGRYIDAPGGSSRSNMKQTLNHYRSAEEPGDWATPYPFGANVEFSDRWMYSGDYFRIKNLTFGYSLPKSVISKIKMSALRVYVSMDNLLTVTDFPGGNPESESFSGGDYVRGVDYGTYPLYKTFIVGVKVGF